MKELIIFVIVVFIIALFLYSKLLPYKDKLNVKFIGIFNLFDSCFRPLQKGLQNIFKPFAIGNGISLDISQIIILVILLSILLFLK